MAVLPLLTVSLQVPFSSPKPYGNDKAPGTYNEADSLADLFLKQHQQHPSLVTPDYHQRELVFASPRQSANEDITVPGEGRQASSRQVAKEALAMIQGGLSSPRETTRALAPRPGKLEYTKERC